MTERIRVAVLGSTGSIGRQALDVLAAHPERFEVVALAAGANVDALDEQVARHKPKLTASAADGPNALTDMATDPRVDLVIVGTSGIVSLKPVIAALSAGKVVATANKETLVAGGHLVMPLARNLAADADADSADAGAAGVAGATDTVIAALHWIRPIDSEHSAIWQCLAGERRSEVTRIILTASGGPFREWSLDRLKTATPRDALAHPTWRMGAKITIDSATLMNKALEVIEARWLYDVEDDQIDVVVHPQSVIHSLVEFADGSLKAQLGLPDMRIPIQYALTYPNHLPSIAPRLTGTEIPTLTFEPVDTARFPALAIGRAAGRHGPRASATLITVDDVAVARFLDGTLDFQAIAQLCQDAVERFAGHGSQEPGLEELIDLDREVREWAATATPARTSGATHA